MVPFHSFLQAYEDYPITNVTFRNNVAWAAGKALSRTYEISFDPC
jgi:hypothetical protein